MIGYDQPSPQMEITYNQQRPIQHITYDQPSQQRALTYDQPSQPLAIESYDPPSQQQALLYNQPSQPLAIEYQKLNIPCTLCITPTYFNDYKKLEKHVERFHSDFKQTNRGTKRKKYQEGDTKYKRKK